MTLESSARRFTLLRSSHPSARSRASLPSTSTLRHAGGRGAVWRTQGWSRLTRHPVPPSTRSFETTHFTALYVRHRHSSLLVGEGRPGAEHAASAACEARPASVVPYRRPRGRAIAVGPRRPLTLSLSRGARGRARSLRRDLGSASDTARFTRSWVRPRPHPCSGQVPPGRGDVLGRALWIRCTTEHGKPFWTGAGRRDRLTLSVRSGVPATRIEAPMTRGVIVPNASGGGR